MASHNAAPGRDPRLRQDENSSKRPAQSPVGGAPPAKFLRHDANSHSRRGSLQSNGSANGQSPLTGCGPASGRASPATALTPMAPMDARADFSSDSKAEFTQMLMTMCRQSAELGSREVIRARAKEDFERASLHFKNTQEYHANYPAIREEKTKAKEGFERKYEEEQKKLSASRTALEKTALSLTDLFFSVNADTATRKEQQNAFQALEKAQDQITRLKKQVESLDRKIFALESTKPVSLVPLHAMTNTIDEKLDKYVARNDEMVKRLENRVEHEARGTASAIAGKVDTSVLSGFQGWVKKDTARLERRIEDLEKQGKKIEHLEKQVKKVEHLEQEVEKQQSAMDKEAQELVDSKIDGLEQKFSAQYEVLNTDIKSLEVSVDGLFELRDRIQTLETSSNELPELQHRLEALQPTGETTLKDRVEFLEGEMEILPQALRESTDGIIQQAADQIIRDVEELMSERTSAAAIQESTNGPDTGEQWSLDNGIVKQVETCLTKLEQLRAEVEQSATKDTEIEQKLIEVSETVREFQKKGTATMSEQPASESLGLVSFQPLPPPSQEPDVAEQDVPAIHRMQSKILALEHTVLLHAQQHANLTTDELVRHMTDQMGTMYPDARNFQGAVQRLDQEDHRLDARLKEFSKTLRVRLDRDEAHRASEDKKLRENITDLATRVGKHDEAIDQGFQGFKNVWIDIETIKASLNSFLDEVVTGARRG